MQGWAAHSHSCFPASPGLITGPAPNSIPKLLMTFLARSLSALCGSLHWFHQMQADFTHFSVFVQCWKLALAFKLAGAVLTRRTSDLHWWKLKWLYLFSFSCNRLCLFAFRFTFLTEKHIKMSPLTWKALLPWQLNAPRLNMAPGWNKRMERQPSVQETVFISRNKIFALLFVLVCNRLQFSVHEGKKGQEDKQMWGASLLSMWGQSFCCDPGSNTPVCALLCLGFPGLLHVLFSLSALSHS